MSKKHNRKFSQLNEPQDAKFPDIGSFTTEQGDNKDVIQDFIRRGAITPAGRSMDGSGSYHINWPTVYPREFSGLTYQQDLAVKRMDDVFWQPVLDWMVANHAAKNGQISGKDLIAYGASCLLRHRLNKVWADMKFPTYFLSEHMMQALTHTEMVSELSLDEFAWPLRSMAVVFPRGWTVTDGETGEEYFTVLGFRAAKDCRDVEDSPWSCASMNRKAKEALGFQHLKDPGNLDDMNQIRFHNIPYVFELWTNLGPYVITQIIGNGEVQTDPEGNRWGEDRSWELFMPVEPGADQIALWSPDENHDRMTPIRLTVFKVLLAMALRPEIIKQGSFQNKGKQYVDAATGKKKNKQRWHPNMIGEKHVSDREYDPDHVPEGTKAPHWRMGHFRNQPYGKGNKLRRVVWIEPIWVDSAAKKEEGS